MNVPGNINNIIERILESEDEWKAHYMAAWGAGERNALRGRVVASTVESKEVRYVRTQFMLILIAVWTGIMGFLASPWDILCFGSGAICLRPTRCFLGIGATFFLAGIWTLLGK